MFRILQKIVLLCATTLLSVGCSRETEQQTPQAASFTPGFGEMMTVFQMRHTKLWFAGQHSSWALAQYQVDGLREGLQHAAKLHPTHKNAPKPIPELIDMTMTPGLQHLDEAIAAADLLEFDLGYDKLTDGCNRCHQATKSGFHIIVRPTSNPYSNQNFQEEPAPASK